MAETLVYISGPMSGIRNLNARAFAKATEKLIAAGFAPVNPHDITISIESENPTWRDYMAADIKALVDCAGVAVLPGWELSRGARLEVKIARELGLWVVPIERIENYEGEVTL